MAHEMEHERHTAPVDRGMLLRLIRYLGPHKKQIALAIVLMLGVAATTLAIPYLAKLIIDEYIAVGDLAGVNKVATFRQQLGFVL